MRLQKAKWQETNGKFLQLLRSNGASDIDKLLSDSIALRERLSEESAPIEGEDKSPRLGMGRVSYRSHAKNVRHLLELEIVPKREMRRLAVAILEAIEAKAGQYFRVEIPNSFLINCNPVTGPSNRKRKIKEQNTWHPHDQPRQVPHRI